MGLDSVTLDVAKEYLKRIKDRYQSYQDAHNFAKVYSLELLTDDGCRTISPFWIGNFETLHGAKIVYTGDSDMQFTL